MFPHDKAHPLSPGAATADADLLHKLDLDLDLSLTAFGTTADDAALSPLPGCEVTEYDAQRGQQAWEDSVFVQDFTDSVLGTAPGPLDRDA